MSKNKFIKTANQELEITSEQILEMDRCMDDPIYFCHNYVKIVHPVDGLVNLALFDYQEDMIQLYQGNDRVIVLSSRQTGKSTVAAAYIAWFAFFHFKKTVLIVSNHNSNSMEIISRIRDIYENLPFWLKPGADADSFNKHELAFDNGSKIISKATTKDSGRGMSISLLYADELAFVNPRFQKEFWAAISPTLATGGDAIITSTPNGDQGLFAELWRNAELGVSEFKHLYVPWDAPPDRHGELGVAFKKKMIGEVGEQKWKQEFECQFISSDELLISSLFLNAITAEVDSSIMVKEVLKVKFWEDIKIGKTYLLGVDPATGSGKDFSVIQVFSFPQMIQIAEYRDNNTSINELYSILRNLLLYLQSKRCTSYFSVENNGVGSGMIAMYQNDEHPPMAEMVDDPKSKLPGMNTTAKNKIETCMQFKQLFETRKMRIQSEILLKELKSYARHRGSFAAQPGATDDCVAAVLIVVRILKYIAAYEDAAFDKLYTGDFGQIAKSEWETSKSNGIYDEGSDTDLGIMVV